MTAPNLRLLLVGHPRSGTQFMARLMAASGYQVGHEMDAANGTSNWLSAIDEPPPEPFTWMRGRRSDYGFNVVLHVVRDPATCIPSVAFTETHFVPDSRPGWVNVHASTALRSRVLGLPMSGMDRFEHAARSVLGWNRLIQRQLQPRLVVRLEHAAEDLARLPELFAQGPDPTLIPSKGVNARAHPDGRAELARLDAGLKAELRQYCLELGYDASAFV